MDCRFLFTAHRLLMVYNCTRFHEKMLNGIRRTDGHTDGGHHIIRPVFDGCIKIFNYCGTNNFKVSTNDRVQTSSTGKPVEDLLQAVKQI